MTIIKDFFSNRLHVMVFDTREAMGRAAGEQAAARIRELLEEKETLNIIFAAAPSQNETLDALAKADGIDWTRVNAYHMDEYVGLAPAHPAGFGNYLRRAVFDRLPFRSVNLINGNAADPEEEARRYGGLLERCPADICLLGVGENGHLAFNDPPVADFHDPVLAKVVRLEERCRQQQVNDGCFEEIGQVPTHAITVTIPGLTAARSMFCSVPAATKAEAVRDMLNGQVSEACPAGILTTHGDAALYLDRDSAKYLL
ncbi:MAG: glucosamine-6-phosphate deaminase [Clostridium sp.]|nr:glucosamine-6-phosphate deaminase [Clostridium sp.]